MITIAKAEPRHIKMIMRSCCHIKFMSSSLKNRSNTDDGGLAEAAGDSMNGRDRGRILFVVRTSEHEMKGSGTQQTLLRASNVTHPHDAATRQDIECYGASVYQSMPILIQLTCTYFPMVVVWLQKKMGASAGGSEWRGNLVLCLNGGALEMLPPNFPR